MNIPYPTHNSRCRPLDRVKLDRNLFDSTNDWKIQNLYMNQLKVMLHHTERIVVIGAETAEQLSQINNYGFQCVQGYIYEKAIPAELFLAKYAEKESVV